MAHEPPRRRQSVPEASCISEVYPHPIAHHLDNTVASHPVTTHPANPGVQGRVLGVQDDSPLAYAPALALGSVAPRSPSLTHVTPPTARPQGFSSSFYPELLRKRIDPARHDVTAEEVAKELLLNAADQRRAADSTGISSEIREFLKIETRERRQRRYMGAPR